MFHIYSIPDCIFTFRLLELKWKSDSSFILLYPNLGRYVTRRAGCMVALESELYVMPPCFFSKLCFIEQTLNTKKIMFLLERQRRKKNFNFAVRWKGSSPGELGSSFFPQLETKWACDCSEYMTITTKRVLKVTKLMRVQEARAIECK